MMEYEIEKMMDEEEMDPEYKALLVDVLTPGLKTKDRLKVVIVKPGFRTPRSEYDLLQCEMIEHSEVRIGGKWIDVWVDEEGLLKEDIVISAYSFPEDPDKAVALAGNILFTGPTDMGYVTNLGIEEILLISKHVMSREGDDESIMIRLDNIKEE